MNICYGLPPSINNESEILILGSMPGKTSLKLKQYYAHPQNRFWKLMSLLLDKDFTNLSYEKKLSLLLSHHIALWDSVFTCKRDSSLDSDIHEAIGNDLIKFLIDYPQIKVICLNGKASWQYFCKNNKSLLNNEKYSLLPLPSTSPANARFSLDDLYKDWVKIKKIANIIFK